MGSRRKSRRSRATNALDSIYDPPDPSPRTLPADVRDEWSDAYQDAYDVYQKDDLAKRAAWRNVTLNWRRRGKKTWQRCHDGVCYWPNPQKIPMPESDLVGLGVLIEYVYMDRGGRLHVKESNRDHPPILWWDDERKLLYAMPKEPYAACKPVPADMQQAAETYYRWHQRPANCYVDVRVPDVRIHAVGAGDSVSYASDKWNEADPDPRLKNAQEYIHNHWYDVWIWQDNKKSPNVIVIGGGELDLHEKGLIH